MEGGSHERPLQRKNDFIVADYAFDIAGGPIVTLPHHAPCGGDGRSCRVGHHSTRARTTGPEHPLVVIRCATHRRCFTVYPVGFAPYLRASLAPTAEATVFDAARDAADEALAAWPRKVRMPHRPERYWRTQTRQIAFAAVLLGLADGGRSDAVADVLGVALHGHCEAVRAVMTGGGARGPGYRERGGAVVRVLDEATSARGQPRSVTSRLYEAGYHARLWGRAWQVGRVGSRVVLQPVFRV